MDEQRKDMESIGQAAARLLGRMDERAKKASGGFERPEKFNSRSAAVVSPVANQNVEGPRERGSERVSALPRQLAVWEDGQGKGHDATPDNRERSR